MVELKNKDAVQLFEDKTIRTSWDEEREEWYFSIVDVIAILTESPNPQTYWRVMKKRLKDEGNETVTNCNALRMTAADGKKRLTDVANTEQLLRIIQSIPSPKAEPFKAWLAMVGRERIEETIDPEQAIDRALETYLKKGYSEISKAIQPKGLSENQDVARQGGEVAGIARQALEARTGRPVITSQNANDFRQLVTDIVADAVSIPERTAEMTEKSNTSLQATGDQSKEDE